MKGNVIDLAIGVIIGSEFGKIVASLVSDVVMPPIGYLIGGVHFTGLFISLNGQHYGSLEEAKKLGAPTINYGAFIQNLFNFVIIAFTIFFLVKAINHLKRSSPETEEKAP